MSDAIRFLHALAQALSAISLYSPGHPAAAKALETAWQALQALLPKNPRPTFFFLGGAPVYNGRALHELADWPWGARLKEVGVQRLEFDEGVTLVSLTRFLELMQVRFTSGSTDPLFPEDAAFTGLRFGPVAVVDALAEVESEDAPQEDDGSRELALNLTDELEAMAFVLAEARRDVVARAEADAVVRILAAQLDRHELPQAAAPDDHAAYPQFHAVNTALMAMAAGGAAGIDPAGRHRLGMAALLHDIGMARLPSELATGETLSAEHRALMETHTVEGARFLMARAGRSLDLAVAVAFEHHLRPDGSGYPARRFNPPAHWASRLTGTCAAYVALRAPRPYRPAWAPLRALAYLEEGAGTVFDAESARALATLVRLVPAS
jgi:HD-GYP domain-containing protein (c-di-GMP phosphodiesterase class II)